MDYNTNVRKQTFKWREYCKILKEKSTSNAAETRTTMFEKEPPVSK